jgi:hypothetical protein
MGTTYNECTIDRVRFTLTSSEASYTTITAGVVRSRPAAQIRAILEVKRNLRYAQYQKPLEIECGRA